MTDESRESLAQQIVTTLPRYGYWVTSFRDFETPYGHLGYRQLAILWLMRFRQLPEEEWTPTRIAAFHRVQPSVVTRALDKLETGGFIKRTHDTLDRRRINLAITEKGIDVSKFVERLYIEDILNGVSSLDDEAIAELARNVGVLAELASSLETLHDDRRTGNGEPLTEEK